ncbi:hypothetical protein BBF96_04740 [Anoxybacter fermentans]|uniref:Uncharacterized protein n=1 Tax=Anoxybacter fermentans TaxID=1323375 RepID=A0A3S9SWS7_9FIRM|nr:DUF3189 family protein [Anoxybacter fermentans]AZR72759.1 hypothetical protein BBF96_04740 [Anoxybacter fermentans]
MKVIYHDKTGRHLSVVAAALHLRLIDKNISRWDLEQLPYFLNTQPPGTLIYIGLDFRGNEIYVLGRKNSFQVIRNAYLGLNRVFQLNNSFLFANVQPLSNLSLGIFDFLNSNPEKEIKYPELLHRGIQKAIPKLVLLVKEVQRRINEGRK